MSANGKSQQNGNHNGNGNGYSRPLTDFTSPWTFAFQSSPASSNTNGNGTNGSPHLDDTQLPTWQALTDIYDPTQRP